MSLLPGHRLRNDEFMNSTIAKLLKLPNDEPRDLDKLTPKPRVVPMKVLCLGFSRTGTLSMHTALLRLGYNPYHMAEVVLDAPVSIPAWIDAMKHKIYGIGKPLTKSDFDKLIGDCDCVEDMPTVLFAEELIKFYPEAKVILTTRPVEDWLRSMRKVVQPVISWVSWDYVAWADPDLAGPLSRLMKWFPQMFGDLADLSADTAPDPEKTHPNSAIARYKRHYERVRAACPPERLLEFHLGDGYDKLCPFLGVETPDEPYPRINDGAFFVGLHQAMIDRATWMAVRKVAAVVVPSVAVVGAVAAWFTGYAARLKR